MREADRGLATLRTGPEVFAAGTEFGLSEINFSPLFRFFACGSHTMPSKKGCVETDGNDENHNLGTHLINELQGIEAQSGDAHDGSHWFSLVVRE